MKRILLFSLLFVCGAMTALAESPWAELRETVQWRSEQQASPSAKPTQSTRQGGQVNATSQSRSSSGSSVGSAATTNQSTSHKAEYGSLIPKILRGQTLLVHVYVSTDKLPLDKNRALAVQKLVHFAYNEWFKNALDVIKEQNREAEFKDILPILQRGISTRVVVEGKLKKELADDVLAAAAGSAERLFAGAEDVAIVMGVDYEVVSKYCNGSACEDHYMDGTAAVVLNDWNTCPYYHGEGWTEENYTETTFEHEFGHTLGIADAYPEGYENNASETNRSKERTDDSMMNHQDFFEDDDADGIINVIDSWNNYLLRDQYKNDWCNHVPTRVKKGWNSLHRNKQSGASVDRYMMGTSVKYVSQLPANQRCDLPANSGTSSTTRKDHGNVKRPVKRPIKRPVKNPVKRPVSRNGKLPPGSADND